MLTIVGILASDYSVNSLLKNERRIEVVELINNKDLTMDIKILNKEFHLKLDKIYGDYQNIKKKFSQFIPSK